MMSANQYFFKTYILIQYIWYQNICLKSCNASPKKQQYSFFFIVWQYRWKLVIQFLYLTVESIHWIQNRRIYVVLNWNKTNVIRQRNLVLNMRRRFQVRRNLFHLFNYIFVVSHCCICIHVIYLQSK